LRHGVAWRHPPKDSGKRRQWAKIQLLDYIQAMAGTDFAVVHRALFPEFGIYSTLCFCKFA
jgi:hypothetical protein